HRHHGMLYGQDPGVVARVDLAYVLFIQGYADQAVACSRDALKLARELNNSFAIGTAFAWGASLAAARRHVDDAFNLGLEGMTVCGANGYPLWMLVSSFGHGWAQARRGDPGAGANELRSAMHTWDAIGAVASKPFQYGLLADSYLAGGNRDDGLRAVDAGLAVAGANGEVWY